MAKKNERVSAIKFGIGLLAIIAFFVGLGAISDHNQRSRERLFKVDDCIADKDRDVWEAEIVGRILEVGDFSYHVCRRRIDWRRDCYLDSTLHFDDQRRYRKVACPANLK